MHDIKHIIYTIEYGFIIIYKSILVSIYQFDKIYKFNYVIRVKYYITFDKMVYEWRDAVVLITGAAKGIGSEVVRLALEEGAKQVVILDVDENNGVSLQRELNDKHGAAKVKFIKCDVTDEEQLVTNFESVLSDKDNTYVVINNAGIFNESVKKYKLEISLNVTAVITGSLKALDLMRKDKGGKGGTIINIASVAALCPLPYAPIYNATKSAVLVFSNGIGMDEYYLRTNVRVLTICFGVTLTGLIDLQNIGNIDDEMVTKMAESLTNYPSQKVESAAQSVIDMYKVGASGSTWMSNADKPVQDITDDVKKGFSIMSEPIFN